jgi:hypothetical protein
MTVIDLVERERRGVMRLIATAGAGAVLAAVAVILAAGVLVLGRARWMELPRLVPFAFWAGAALALALGIWWARHRARREATSAGLALAVEREQALRAGSLRGVLEVASTGALGRRAAEQVAERLREVRKSTDTLAPRLRRRAMGRALVATAVGLAGVFTLYGRSSAAPDGWQAIAHPVRAWRGTLLPSLTLTDAPASVLRGERLRLTIAAVDRREIAVAQRAKGSAWRVSRVAVRNGRAQITLGPVDADVMVFAADGRSASDTALVRVVDRPFLGDVAVKASFPGYLARNEETLPLGEPARLPQGTVLTIDGQSSTELRRVVLVNGTDTVAFAPIGRRFNGRLTNLRTGRYVWSASGSGGDIADLPAPLEVEIVPDSAPHVEIIAPTRDSTVASTDSIVVSVLASDDHGLGTVQLRTWTKSAGKAAVSQPDQALADNPSTQWSGDALLDLSTLSLQAGDEVHVVATGVDESPWHQRGESRELVLRIPGLSEQRDNARALADTAVQRAQAAAAAERQLQQRTTEAARARDRRQQQGEANGDKSGSSSLSYESSEQAKQLAKEQRQLAERVQQLQEMAKQLEKQLKQTGALDSGLAARLQEAQKLLRDALTPELAEQLRKLEEASQKLSPEEARSAMANLAQQQQRLREQLEKSVEMLKRAALEGSMQTLKDEAKDLAKQQRQLADSMEKSRTDDAKRDAKQQARDLAQRSKDLAQDVSELQKRLEEQRAQTGAERVNEAEQNVKESANAMQRATQQQRQNAAGQQQQSQQNQQRGDQTARQGRDSTGERLDARSRQNGDSAQRQADARGQKSDSAGPEQRARQNAQQQAGQQQAGQQQAGQQQSGQQQAGQQQSGQQQSGQQQSGQQQSGQQQNGQQGSQDARQAAEAMEKAAEQLSQAREQQINEWKKELTSELDQSIQEMLQLAREQTNLEQQARDGAEKNQLQAQQSALQQGVDKAGQRLDQAGQKSSLLSNRSQRAVSDARKKVEQATRELAQSRAPNDAASAMRESSEALNQAAASLVRDRERAQTAQSASGFAEMLQQMQEMARQQGALNAATLELMPKSGQLDQNGRQGARQLAQRQKALAENLDDAGDRDRSGRAEELAKEARQIAQALENGAVDQAMAERQQRLFRRMLDAGRTLEQDQRDDTGKRESKPGIGFETFAPSATSASGKAAQRFQPPTWNDLRGLSPEQRRMVLEYFKRINADKP